MAILEAVAGRQSSSSADSQYLDIIDNLPTAVYATDADGVVTFFNRAAADLAGREPRIGKDRWCVSWRLYRPDGTRLPLDQCPMARTLKERRPVRGEEVIAERPDGTRVSLMPFPTPRFDGAGRLVGAVNMLVEIRDAGQPDERQDANRITGGANGRPYATRSDVDFWRGAEEAQRQLAMIVESSDDAIISKDLEGTIISWNAGAQRLYGYTAEEAVGQPVTLLFPIGRDDEELRILERIRRGESVEHYDTVRRRKDGTLVDVSLTVSPVKDGRGQIIGASKIARDISERKQTERALAKSVKEQATLYQFTDRLHRAQSLSDVYDAAFDAIADGLGCERASILLLDRSRTMRFVASRGISEDYRRAVDGHSPWSADVIYPSPICIENVEESDLSGELKEKVRSEGIAALAFIPLMSGSRLIGKFMTYYSEPHSFTEQELSLALTIARQLSFGVERTRAEAERRRFEESLLESEDRLEMALNAGRMGAWEWNMSTGRVVWSPGLEKIHGLAPGAFGGTFDEFKRDIHPDDVGRVLAAVNEAAASAGEYHVAYRINHPNGTVRWLEASGRSATGYDSAETRLVGVCTDITERKEAEAQRDLLLAELSHRVKNTLATVVSIARQSFARSQNIDEAIASFDARIRALAQTHTRLAEASWSGVSFETMLNDELAPYRREDGSNLRVSGPSVRLTPRSALTLGMAIHELATNAAKHGALSSKKGAVDVSWRLDPDKLLHIRWSESGGPPVSAPERKGFGRLLLERALASDLHGDVQLDFARDGLTCSITLPIDEQDAFFVR